MAMITRNQETKDAVIKNIARDMSQFGISQFELPDRISVKFDEEQFNAKEDESVWLQKTGKAPFVCEVYFDNVFICDLHENYSHEKLISQFFKGFLKGYESGKIRLNRILAATLDEMEKTAKKDAEANLKKSIEELPSTTPEERMSKEIVKEVIKEKNAPSNKDAT